MSISHLELGLDIDKALDLDYIQRETEINETFYIIILLYIIYYYINFLYF